MVRKFTKELANLYVAQKLDLSESLKIMMHKGKKHKSKVSAAAGFLFNCLECGNLLSNGIRTCPYINFDESYANFISLSEKSGDLRKTVSYLNEKYERRYENKTKLVEVSLYPFFVVFLAVISCIFVCRLGGSQNYEELIQSVVVLTGICSGIFFFIGKIISEDKLYEAFLGIDFLIKAGVNVSTAVESAVFILGPDSKLGKSFIQAGEKLEFGMSLENAFKLGERYQEAFYYADSCGRNSDVFLKLAGWMEEQARRKRKICFSLLEPLFIVITGVFLLLLIMKFFMPFMNDLKWI